MKRLISFMFSLLAVLAANALEIPEIFGDNMVLQQNTKAKVWGWAEAGHYIKVTASWTADAYVAKAQKDGRWMIEVSTPVASYDKYSITFAEYKTDPDKDKKAAALDTKVSAGVLIGEVWSVPDSRTWRCRLAVSGTAR